MSHGFSLKKFYHTRRPPNHYPQCGQCVLISASDLELDRSCWVESGPGNGGANDTANCGHWVDTHIMTWLGHESQRRCWLLLGTWELEICQNWLKLTYFNLYLHWTMLTGSRQPAISPQRGQDQNLERVSLVDKYQLCNANKAAVIRAIMGNFTKNIWRRKVLQ